MDVTFRRFVENIKTVVSNFRLFPAEAVGYLSIPSTFTLASTEEKAQGSQTFAGRWRTDQGGACLWIVDLFPQLASLLCICVHRSEGLDRVVNVSIYSKDVPF